MTKMIRVRDCMSSPPLVIGPDAPAWEALGLMRRHRIRRLPVEEGGTVVGIVTWTDLVRVQPPAVGGLGHVQSLSADVLIRHLMTAAPITVAPDATLSQVAEIMRQFKIGGLPVVEDGRLVGMITESDLFDAFAEMFGIGPLEVVFHVAVGSIMVELPRVVQALARAGVPVCSVHSVRARETEGIDIVVHERDAERTEDVLGRLALQVEMERRPAAPEEE